jgi:hypothetical protein
MKKNLLLLLLCLIIYSKANAQNDSAIVRAPYWFESGMIGQVGLLYGIFDGLSLGGGLAMSTLEPGSDCYKVGVRGLNSLSILENVRLMDIQDEISRIYSDSTNLCLTVPHAFWLAANKLTKMDSVSYKKLLNQYKDEDCISIPEPKKAKKTKKSKHK